MAASNFSLSNLTVVLDCNGMQSDGKKSEIMDHLSIGQKFQAFGFHVSEIDGHQHSAVEGALGLPHESKPLAIVAHTIKGKGVSFMEGNPDWHHGVLTPKLFEMGMAELEKGM